MLRDKSLVAELAVVAVAVIVRLCLVGAYSWQWGFDSVIHLDLAKAVAELGPVAPNFPRLYLAYNPPLYYVLAGALWKATQSTFALQLFSVLSGALRLLLVWWAARRWLDATSGRLAALFAAGFLPASVHVDLLLSNESLNATLGTASLVAFAEIFATPRPSKWLVVLAGASSALGLLTKVSILTTFGIVALIATLALFWAPYRARATYALAALAIALALGVPMHALRRTPGTALFPTMYDVAPGIKQRVAALEATAAWKRRPLSYYGISNWTELVAHPFAPTLQNGKDARYWPVLVDSLFVDYWGHRFSGDVPPRETSRRANGWPVRERAFQAARVSLLFGIVFCLIVVGGSVVALVASLRTKTPMGLFVLAPFAAALAGLAFAVKFPYDDFGLVKGIYVLFAALPSFIVFGHCVQRGIARPRLAVPVLFVLIPMLVAFVVYDLSIWL